MSATPNKLIPEYRKLAARDQRLRGLEQWTITLAITTKRGNHLRVFYDIVKPWVCSMVGWERKPLDPVLSTSKAYDVAYKHLNSVLTSIQYRMECIADGQRAAARLRGRRKKTAAGSGEMKPQPVTRAELPPETRSQVVGRRGQRPPSPRPFY